MRVAVSGKAVLVALASFVVTMALIQTPWIGVPAVARAARGATEMAASGDVAGASSTAATSGAAPITRGAAPIKTGAAIPDMLFSYEPADLPPMFEALGEAGRAAYLRMNALDFAFAASYGAALALALAWLAGRLAPASPWLGLAAIAPVVGALADEAENVIFRAAASGLSLPPACLSAASFLSTLKYVALYASYSLVATGLVALAVLSAARKRKGGRL